MTTRQYKNFKGLRKENLRDHMTRTESALNTLAEVAKKMGAKLRLEPDGQLEAGGRLITVADHGIVERRTDTHIE